MTTETAISSTYRIWTPWTSKNRGSGYNFCNGAIFLPCENSNEKARPFLAGLTNEFSKEVYFGLRSFLYASEPRK